MDLPQLLPLQREPLVSVLIVNYNYERFLGEAIESVLAQSYQNFEIIICDDGSIDNSAALIANFADREPRIKAIVRPNTGMAGALNDSYAASSGAIVAMLDADDLFEREKLSRVANRLSAGGRVGMLFHPLSKIDADGQPNGRMPQFGQFDHGELRSAILASGGHFAGAPNSAIALRRECAAHVFPVPVPEFRSEADAYIRAAAALFFAVGVIDEPLSAYRVHSSNLTASSAVDLAWAEKSVAATVRIVSAIEALAKEHGWEMAPLEDNPSYCETSLIRDYLRNAGYKELLLRIRQLQRATAKVKTPDRHKLKLKARILGSAVLLPQAIGRRIIEGIYLPNAFKRAASELRRRGH